MFSHWISDWEAVDGKRLRRVSLTLGSEIASVVTIFVDPHLGLAEVNEIERFFEAGPNPDEFRFRSGVVDPDPAGATLMEVSVRSLVVDLDVYHRGIDPRPGGYIGMGAMDDSE